MSDLKSVIDRAKDMVTPSEREAAAMERRVAEVKAKLERCLKGLDADVFVGGSYAKNTWLPGSDVDVFIRFDLKYDRISESLERALKKEFPRAEKVHGSRPYFRIKGFEFVPIYRISKHSEARNITDFSPLHVGFVNEFLENPVEVRLLKQFCKANGVYGAETHRKAFSGYVLELLIIAYGGFVHAIDELSNRQPKIHIDFGEQHDLSKHKLSSPIVIHDPVQPDRNAAAALSYRNFYRFVFESKNFLDDPSIEFFKDRTLGIEDVRARSKRRGTKLFTKRLDVEGNPDIFFAKLDKELKRIRSLCESKGFSVYDYGFVETGKRTYVYFEFLTHKVAKARRHLGPPIRVDEHMSSFMTKWEGRCIYGPYVWENRVAVDIEEETDPVDFVKDLVDEI